MADDQAVLDLRIKAFLSWCEDSGLELSSKVRVGTAGSCHRYGMIATEDIAEGECLFTIPRQLVLSPSTSAIADIIKDLPQEEDEDTVRSTWVPLLLCLMYEYTNPQSKWRPYLDLVPDEETLGHPMFWDADERRELLEFSGIDKDIESDLEQMQNEYENVAIPFMKQNPKYFSLKKHTLSLYQRLAAFVMGYSFTEGNGGEDEEEDEDDDEEEEEEDRPSSAPPAPVMVPMADILNHISYHNAHLEFEVDCLKMVAIKPIEKGKEVFNTYGKLGNCHLLQSYGFVEDDAPNPYDTVELAVRDFLEVINRSDDCDANLLKSKVEFFQTMDMVDLDDSFSFSKFGCCMHGPDLKIFLKILHLTVEEFLDLLEGQATANPTDEDLDFLLEEIPAKKRIKACNNIIRTLTKSSRKRTHKQENSSTKRNQGAKKLKQGSQEEELTNGSQRRRSARFTSNRKTSEGSEGEDDNHSSSGLKLDSTETQGDAKQELDNKSQNGHAHSCQDSQVNGKNGKVDKEETVVEETKQDTSDPNSNSSLKETEEEMDDDDDDDDDNDDVLSYDEIARFPDAWKATLKSVAEQFIDSSPDTMCNITITVDKDSVSKKLYAARQIQTAQQRLYQCIVDRI